LFNLLLKYHVTGHKRQTVNVIYYYRTSWSVFEL